TSSNESIRRRIHEPCLEGGQGVQLSLYRDVGQLHAWGASQGQGCPVLGSRQYHLPFMAPFSLRFSMPSFSAARRSVREAILSTSAASLTSPFSTAPSERRSVRKCMALST